MAGAGIAMFMWAPAARRFLKKCRRKGVSPAVYINCGTAIEEPEKAKTRFFDRGMEKFGIEPDGFMDRRRREDLDAFEVELKGLLA